MALVLELPVRERNRYGVDVSYTLALLDVNNPVTLMGATNTSDKTTVIWDALGRHSHLPEVRRRRIWVLAENGQRH